MIMSLRVPQDYKEGLYRSCLSPLSIHETFHESCANIADWTQAIDYGPYVQKQEVKFNEDEPEGLGPTESNSISTIQFLELKKWQVF